MIGQLFELGRDSDFDLTEAVKRKDPAAIELTKVAGVISWVSNGGFAFDD